MVTTIWQTIRIMESIDILNQEDKNYGLSRAIFCSIMTKIFYVA